MGMSQYYMILDEKLNTWVNNLSYVDTNSSSSIGNESQSQNEESDSGM